MDMRRFPGPEDGHEEEPARQFKIILSPRKMLDVTILTWPGDISPITQNSDIMDLICPSFQILDVTILKFYRL